MYAVRPSPKCRYAAHDCIINEIIFWDFMRRIMVVFTDVSGQLIGPISRGQRVF